MSSQDNIDNPVGKPTPSSLTTREWTVGLSRNQHVLARRNAANAKKRAQASDSGADPRASNLPEASPDESTLGMGIAGIVPPLNRSSTGGTLSDHLKSWSLLPRYKSGPMVTKRQARDSWQDAHASGFQSRNEDRAADNEQAAILNDQLRKAKLNAWKKTHYYTEAYATWGDWVEELRTRLKSGAVRISIIPGSATHERNVYQYTPRQLSMTNLTELNTHVDGAGGSGDTLTGGVSAGAKYAAEEATLSWDRADVEAQISRYKAIEEMDDGTAKEFEEKYGNLLLAMQVILDQVKSSTSDASVVIDHINKHATSSVADDIDATDFKNHHALVMIADEAGVDSGEPFDIDRAFRGITDVELDQFSTLPPAAGFFHPPATITPWSSHDSPPGSTTPKDERSKINAEFSGQVYMMETHGHTVDAGSTFALEH